MTQAVKHRGRYQMQEPFAVFKLVFPDERYANECGFFTTYEKECPVCSGTFLGNKDQVYCSRACCAKAFMLKRKAVAE